MQESFGWYSWAVPEVRGSHRVHGCSSSHILRLKGWMRLTTPAPVRTFGCGACAASSRNTCEAGLPTDRAAATNEKDRVLQNGDRHHVPVVQYITPRICLQAGQQHGKKDWKNLAVMLPCHRIQQRLAYTTSTVGFAAASKTALPFATMFGV